jgi:hypothetical protein
MCHASNGELNRSFRFSRMSLRAVKATGTEDRLHRKLERTFKLSSLPAMRDVVSDSSMLDSFEDS